MFEFQIEYVNATVSAHLVGMHSAMKMLVGRLGVLCATLQKMESGVIPFDHDLMRKIASLTNRLPIMDGGEFPENFLTVVLIHLLQLENKVLSRRNFPKSIRRCKKLLILPNSLCASRNIMMLS